MTRAIEATVAGRVHGVGFRYSTQRVATGLGVSGWVRNISDGTVGLRAQGAPEAIEQLLAFLEHGPPHAAVVSITVHEVAADPALTGFGIK